MTRRYMLAFGIILMMIPAAAARPVKFCDLCSGYTVSKKGDDVLIRCPGLKDPWMTIKNCPKPVVKRNGADVTITCT